MTVMPHGYHARALSHASFDGTLYANQEMAYLEAVLPPGPWKTAHGPSLLQTQDKSILCCWFAGTYEGDTDINIVVSRLEPGASAWSEPTYISFDFERSNQNPSLFLVPAGAELTPSMRGSGKEIWALYTAQRGREPGKDNMQFTSQIKRQVSIDDGKTWGTPDVIFAEKGTFARQSIQVLSNGRWVYGNWICSDSERGLAGDPSAFRISDDQGATWSCVGVPHSHGRVHPSVVETEPGHLLAYMRSRDADFIYRSESYDFGSTWSAPVATELPNNNASISVIKLTSGRIALTYNHASAPQAASNKGAWPGLRCPVSVALSEDGGYRFPLIRHIEQGEGYAGSENRSSNHQYEYPCIMQSSDGMIHIAYAFKTRQSVKWVCVSEEALIGIRRGSITYNPTSGEVI